jgi:D-sedoheptulose 7-phosphate isomerase
MKAAAVRELEESVRIKKLLAGDPADIVDAARKVIDAFRAGRKLLLIGNGGSAADAQHIATELVGRFRKERKALPAIALTTDTSLLTALANDYGYETVFSRQIEALADAGDVLLAITTSGTSPNVVQAVKKAKTKGVFVIALTGQGGGKLKALADLTIAVPSKDTARIQEAHITIEHVICHLVEEGLFNEAGRVSG